MPRIVVSKLETHCVTAGLKRVGAKKAAGPRVMKAVRAALVLRKFVGRRTGNPVTSVPGDPSSFTPATSNGPEAGAVDGRGTRTSFPVPTNTTGPPTFNVAAGAAMGWPRPRSVKSTAVPEALAPNFQTRPWMSPTYTFV